MQRSVYLDHAATTPVHPEVLAAMLPYFTRNFGNPSSVHAFGRESRIAVDKARATIANAINADAREIVFTSGGTEADNMAIQGVAIAMADKGKHIITSSVEHHAVLDTCEYLAKQGWEVTFLPVDEFGRISLADLEAAIRPDTVLISLIHGNNEVGTMQPVAEVGELARKKGIVFHVDAVQTVGTIPVDVKALKVDLLSFSAHKFYGPKGIGALYIRKGTRIKPLVHGGGQERKYRPGTENHAAIVGMARALEFALENMSDNVDRVTALRDRLIKGLLEIPEVRLNGHPTDRLPGNVNVGIRYVEGESLILSLDMKGVAVSSGSACTSGALDPSHVLLAMGMSHEIAHGSLRLTLGIDTTDEDIDYVLSIMPAIVDRLRKMSPLYNEK
jgi:cysteine desulfurase